jgi:MerR family transcriptional regulator, light-induced transcriptional regulator
MNAVFLPLHSALRARLDASWRRSGAQSSVSRRSPTTPIAEKESELLRSGAPSDPSTHECATPMPAMSSHAPGSAWPTASAERLDARKRLARLARTLEAEVIPRLVGAHRDDRARMLPEPREIEAFVQLLRNGSEADVAASVDQWYRRGASVEAIFLDLFAPAARHLGELWDADRCNFSMVTICLGRLQRLLREWSPAFGIEVEHPPNGRRILLAQHPDEQHSFGLSMAAEFFRRSGWEVLGGVGGAVADPSAQAAREWFDVVGFSIGSETRLDWLRERIARVRADSCNQGVVVLVGGPLAAVKPDLAQAVGADAAGEDGTRAAQLAEGLIAARFLHR